MAMLVVVALVAAMAGTGGHAFNIDTAAVVVQAGPRDTCGQDCMFGFSVAQHSEGGVPWWVKSCQRTFAKIHSAQEKARP